jgi:cell division septal protein FtsQ
MGAKRDPWMAKHPLWVVFFVFLFVIGCVYLIYGLPAWRVTTFRVSGQYTLPLAELREITRAQQRSRWLLFFHQENLWAFDTRAYERRLRERWMFSTLNIRRTMPNTLTLSVVEEQPAFVYQLQNAFVGIDRDGIASTYLPAIPSGIPELTFLEPPNIALNEAALSPSQSSFLATFIGRVKERNEEKLTVKRVSVAVAPDTTLRLGMAGDWEIIVNTAASADAQVEALLLAYDQKLKGQELEYVDVSVPSRVYTK